MADLDQGGTFRQTQKVYLGPSIGWVTSPGETILRVTSVGTTIIQLGNSLVLVNINGLVTLTLPTAKTAALAAAQPMAAVLQPLTIADIGGFAAANPITINASGSDLIDGLASITIASNFGVVTLIPDPVNGGWSFSA